MPHSGAEDWWRSWLVRTSAALLGTLVLALALVAAFVEYWPSRRRGTCRSG